MMGLAAIRCGSHRGHRGKTTRSATRHRAGGVSNAIARKSAGAKRLPVHECNRETLARARVGNEKGATKRAAPAHRSVQDLGLGARYQRAAAVFTICVPVSTSVVAVGS